MLGDLGAHPTSHGLAAWAPTLSILFALGLAGFFLLVARRYMSLESMQRILDTPPVVEDDRTGNQLAFEQAA